MIGLVIIYVWIAPFALRKWTQSIYNQKIHQNYCITKISKSSGGSRQDRLREGVAKDRQEAEF